MIVLIEIQYPDSACAVRSEAVGIARQGVESYISVSWWVSGPLGLGEIGSGPPGLFGIPGVNPRDKDTLARTRTPAPITARSRVIPAELHTTHNLGFGSRVGTKASSTRDSDLGWAPKLVPHSFLASDVLQS